MDTKKIGGFLKSLRTTRGLTQEQLAEILSVSGRTISRWETGSNMPELSVLIQIAEFYNVEVTEILDGERKSESMDKEMKQTLEKAADYSKIEKERVARAGQLAFGTIFIICVIAIVVQLLMTGNLLFVAGETVTLLIGGVVYLGLMIHNGLWDAGLKNTPFTDALISVICSGGFTVLLVVCYEKLGAVASQIVHTALLFFVGIAIIGFIVLRMMALLNQKRKQKMKASSEALENPVKQIQAVQVFIADGNLQAQMIMEALRNQNIAVYGQDMGDAGFAAVRYGMGRGMNDCVAIMVADKQAEAAKKVIEEMGLK